MTVDNLLAVIEYLVGNILKSACQEVRGCHGNIFKKVPSTEILTKHQIEWRYL